MRFTFKKVPMKKPTEFKSNVWYLVVDAKVIKNYIIHDTGTGLFKSHYITCGGILHTERKSHFDNNGRFYIVDNATVYFHELVDAKRKVAELYVQHRNIS